MIDGYGYVFGKLGVRCETEFISLSLFFFLFPNQFFFFPFEHVIHIQSLFYLKKNPISISRERNKEIKKKVFVFVIGLRI